LRPESNEQRDFLILAALLVWTVLVRLPLLGEPRLYGDEGLYALVGHQWLQGHPPYTILMDMKPPGIFGLYALTEAIFDDPLLAPRLLPVMAAFATAVALWRIGIAWFGDRTVGLLAAVIYPPYTLVLGGVQDTSALMLAPFVAFGLLLAARPELWSACLAGLLFGIAGTIKHIAVFEALVGLALVARAQSGSTTTPWARVIGFGLGCLAPIGGFATYYAALGHLAELWNAVIVWAARRSQIHVAFLDGPVRLLAMLKPILPLAVLAAFALTERRWFRGRPNPARFAALGSWFLAATAGVLVQRAAYEHYLLALVPPLALAAALLLAELHRRTDWFRRPVMLAALVALVGFPPGWVTAQSLWPAGDHDAMAIAAELRRLGITAGNTQNEVYVVDHEPAIYLLTGTVQPTRFAYPAHLQCDFALPPGVDPEAEIDRVMALRPRIIVISERRARLMCTLPDRMARYERHLAAGYALVGRVGPPGARVEIHRRTADP
jgi:hypothetical protein